MSDNRQQTGRLLQHSILMLAATQAGNLANMLFQILMNHRLSDTEYGALAAMLGLITITATPLDALRTAAAHFTARLRLEGQTNAVASMLFVWLRKLSWLAVIVLALGCAAAPWTADYLKLPTGGVAAVGAVVIALAIFVPVLSGGLQGLETFGWYAAVAPTWGISRLLVGAILTTWIAATALMGLLAQAAATLLSAGIAAIGLWRVLPRSAPAEPSVATDAYAYFGGAFCVLLGFAVLMNGDVVLAKIFFPPETAGLFARAANIARAVVFLPMPIALAMFPKVVEAGPETASGNRQTMKTAFLYTLILVIISVIICSAAADLLWRLFTGSVGSPSELQMLRALALALTPLGPAYLLLNFELARKRFQTAIWLALIAAAYITSVAIFHRTLTHIVIALAAANCAAVVAMAALASQKSNFSPKQHLHFKSWQ